LAKDLGGWEVVFGSASTITGAANRAAGGREGRKASDYSDLDAAYRNGFADGIKSVKTPQKVRTRNWRQWAQDIVREEQDCLSDWEINFFGSFGAGRYPVPSDKQMKIFVRVAARLDLALPESTHNGSRQDV
jgi:hypothetical protein